MSLPKLTAFIGENVNQGNIFSSLIKPVKKINKTEQPYIVFLILDLHKDEIYFKLHKKFTEDSTYQYYYFGNNPAAKSQYYLTRESKDIKYLLTSTFNDLNLLLKKYDMSNCELSNIIKQLENKNIISLGIRKGDGRLNLQKFSILKNGKIKKIELDEKNNIIVDGKKINADSFIRLFINDSNKKNKFVLIIPVVKLEDEKEVILSVHPDYLELVKKDNKLTDFSDNKKSKRKQKRICYICGLYKDDVSSEYSKKFDRTGINKIFTTTTKNTSPYLNKFNYDNVYSMCKDCYQKLKNGEKVISKQFKGKIADEDVFIIPQGLFKNFDYNFLNMLKRNVDLAFNTSDADEWLQMIESELEENEIEYYSVNFIVYRTDGNSVKVLQTIEDVPTLRIKRVIQTISKNKNKLELHLKEMGLGSIYRIIPVKINKEKQQVDVGRVLSLYKSILSGEMIEHKILYSYAVEALEKGLKQLSKHRIDNYYNMELTRYIQNTDFFIKHIVYSYIALINTCQDLNLLDKTVFNFLDKEGERLSINTPSKEINQKITLIEEFLNKHGFNNDARALFYLGILVNRVACTQLGKGHNTKPVLKKIQFQGMSQKEVYRLYHDIVEKLHQYNRMTLFAEAIMNRFHNYFGTLDREWILNEHANVFYIMAGYSYLVGNNNLDFSIEEQ